MSAREGHDFSRAETEPLTNAASAAEGHTLRERKPQRLKPLNIRSRFGTSKLVPFPKRRVIPSAQGDSLANHPA